MEYNGVDVSELQGSVNWGCVESTGKINFAMIRATYGSSGVDSQFINNMRYISQTNIYPGAYHQSSANSVNEAVAEANHFLSVIRPYNFYYPLALHIESEVPMQTGKNFFTSIISSFLDVVREARYWPMLYAKLDMINDNINTDLISNVDIWLADLTTNDPPTRPSYDKNVTIWQHSCRGSVKGISGNANLNISYVDYPKVIAEKGWNNLPTNMSNNNGSTMNNNRSNNNAGTMNNNMSNSNAGNMNNNMGNNTGNTMNNNGGAMNNNIGNSNAGSMGSNAGNVGSNAGNMGNMGSNAGNMGSNAGNMGSNAGNIGNNAGNMGNVAGTMSNNNGSTNFNMRNENLESDFSEPSFYTVGKGDTLRNIAKKLLGDPEQYRRIMELNGLTRPIIFAGQTLRIPQNVNSDMILYRINAGDTLWKIAERFLGQGPRYEEIMRLNGLTTDMIYPGQILKIPAEQNMAMQTYTVQEGDTLWKIAQNFLGNGNRYNEIMSLNNLNSGALRIGQSLKIPLK